LTRHNVGFMFIDYLAEKYGLSLAPSRFDYYAAEGSVGENKFFLVKPTTFVNNSGTALAQFQDQTKIKPQDMLVVYDDLNIPLADVRIRYGGSHGGHNGIYSLIYNLNTNQFPRLRLGIGQPHEKGKMAQFVLTKLEYDEYQKMQDSFAYCQTLVESFLAGGVKHMLDENSKMKDPGPTTQKPDSEEAAEEKPESGNEKVDDTSEDPEDSKFNK
jgi:peptidyl-tRNA hydrolase, PTH1 family